MINTQDLREKEVINIRDGRSMGFVYDLEVNWDKGTVEGIVVPLPRRGFAIGGREEERVIPWRDVRKVGEDVILVETAGNAFE
ncbi:MAG: YlmC/YmxH family sporulation protein [Firmicutes bacterium]|nr:YlmC/YmxH family sporulation protein [Bacillota bacterium]